MEKCRFGKLVLFGLFFCLLVTANRSMSDERALTILNDNSCILDNTSGDPIGWALKLGLVNSAQADAWNRLSNLSNENFVAKWNMESALPAVFSGFANLTPSSDPNAILDNFYSVYWDDLSAMLGLSDKDSFNCRMLGSWPSEELPFRFRCERLYVDIPVLGNFIEIWMTPEGGLRSPTVPLEKSNVYEVTESGLPNFTVTSMHANIAPIVGIERHTSIPDSIPFRALVDLGLNPPSDKARYQLVILIVDSVPVPAFRIFSSDSEGLGVIYTVDANTGEQVLPPRLPAELTKSGVIKVPATNPHESYSPTIGKTSYKALPYAPLFSSTQQEGNIPVCQGTEHLPGERTDFHGNFLISRPQTAWFNSPCTLDATESCPTQDCFAVGLRRQESPTNIVEVVPTNYIFPISLPYRELNMTRLIRYVATKPNGSSYLLSWRPFLDDSSRCLGTPETSPNYDIAVKASSHQGLWFELSYHLARAKYILGDFTGNPMTPVNLRLYFNPTLNLSGCNGGQTNTDTRTADLLLYCGYCSDDPAQKTNSAEMATRALVYHEATHWAEMSAGGDEGWTGNFGGDLPECDGYCENEGLAMYGSAFASGFEGNFNARSDSVTRYPHGIQCGAGYGQYSKHYRNGYFMTYIYYDLTMALGHPAFRFIMWMPELLTDTPGNETRLVDPSCAGSWNYENCANANTLYRKLLETSSGYNADYEVSWAYHAHVTDGNPGIITCLGDTTPSGTTCTGNYACVSNPPRDRYPWFDDVTNDPGFAPFIQTDLATGSSSTAITDFGQIEYSSITCSDEFSDGTKCKKLALDYGNGRPSNRIDIDRFSVYLRAGELYRFRAEASPYPITDTVLSISDSSGNILDSNDNCAEDPNVFDLGSCLYFVPQNSGRFILSVEPYRGPDGYPPLTGSARNYALGVQMFLDDHGDDRTSSTPIPVFPTNSGFPTNVAAFVNSSTDVDYFHFYVPSGGWNLVLYSYASTQLARVKVQIFNAQGSAITTEMVGEDVSWNGFLPQGLYFVSVKRGGSVASGQYWLRLEKTIEEQCSNSQDSALDIDSMPSLLASLPKIVPGVFYPNGNLRSCDSHYYRFYAEKGQRFDIDAHGSIDVDLEIQADRTLATSPEDRVSGAFWFPDIILLEDKNGGLIQDPYEETDQKKWKRNAHLGFTAPWNGFYYAVVKRPTAYQRGYYKLCFDTRSRLINYPQEP